MPAVTKSANLHSPEAALEAFLDTVIPVARASAVDLEYADNRVLSTDLVAPKDYPHYDLCFMDGFAVRAKDTAGARPGSGVVLRCPGGEEAGQGECVQVHTGSALPPGADAVVKVEDTEVVAGGIQIYREAASGDNFTPRGKSIRRGEIVFRAGMQLKPTNIALLASLGLTEVEVYDRPRVLIIPTGDELVERGRQAGPGSINESNGLMCQLLVKRYGGKPALWSIVPDNMEKLTEAVRAGLRYDLIVTTGGTSVGKRDLMPRIVASMGKIVVHGVGMRPGRPVGMGYVEEGERRTPIVFLPGFPDACAVSAMFFVCPAVRKLGRYPPLRYPTGAAIVAGTNHIGHRSRSITKVRVQDGKAMPVPTVGPAPLEGEYSYVITPENREHGEGEKVELKYLE